MALKDLDIGAALHRLADRKIEQAMREGKFDNLPGFGKPLELEPMPAEEDARLRWWALRILKQNDVIPDEVQWRKQIEKWKEELANAKDRAHAEKLCRLINALVQRLNTMGTNAMTTGVSGVSMQSELEKRF
jgi:hypothetical protein